ncbi:efflux RND transporter periplasmic adaptor subunit [Rhizobium sp. DKSPLA3]|uniref:Efflux RND transporter periplasmic adaptor subunit n=2 Tax=Rhizobium quercicola TaxID=2901226 RepID=A0A9X1T6W5_9HYPH|nr:efflux RND transporter periplasmic adaptor subunit [Rhizobium quercicola]MCD7109183.1 efflux RND transporter periplasmic adaptor subunit [Rhizobium quercicola]
MAGGRTFAYGMRTAAQVPALLTACLLAATPALTRDALAQEATPPAADTQAAPETAYPSIVVTKAEMRTVTDRVIATGTIQAVEETFVQPLVEGLSIRSLAVDIGDTVEADGIMATLNDDALLLTRSQNEANLARAHASLAQYQAQLVEAQANAQEAVRVSARNAKLKEAGSVSTALADQTEAAAAAALARVNSAEQLIAVAQSDIKVVEAQISDVDLRLARTVVKAPVAGTVSARTAKVGAIAAGAGQPLFTIIRDGAVEMRADVSESDLLKLAVGQKATLKLADSSVTLDGTIRLISPTVDADTRLGTVFISITEPERARVGMYANADITVAEKQALALPLTAVTSGKTETVVRKVRDGVVEMARVETGIQDGRYIEIRTGLEDGDEVVAKAGAYVRDGDRITPVKATAPADKTAAN